MAPDVPKPVCCAGLGSRPPHCREHRCDGNILCRIGQELLRLREGYRKLFRSRDPVYGWGGAGRLVTRNVSGRVAIRRLRSLFPGIVQSQSRFEFELPLRARIPVLDVVPGWSVWRIGACIRAPGICRLDKLHAPVIARKHARVEDGRAVALGVVDQWRDPAAARAAGVLSRNDRVVRERAVIRARRGTGPSS